MSMGKDRGNSKESTLNRAVCVMVYLLRYALFLFSRQVLIQLSRVANGRMIVNFLDLVDGVDEVRQDAIGMCGHF